MTKICLRKEGGNRSRDGVVGGRKSREIYGQSCPLIIHHVGEKSCLELAGLVDYTDFEPVSN